MIKRTWKEATDFADCYLDGITENMYVGEPLQTEFVFEHAREISELDPVGAAALLVELARRLNVLQGDVPK
jgi:hypothetical protein